MLSPKKKQIDWLSLLILIFQDNNQLISSTPLKPKQPNQTQTQPQVSWKKKQLNLFTLLVPGNSDNN